MITLASRPVLRVMAALAVMSCAFALPRVARAQPAVNKTSQADALFDEGKALMKAGKLAEACAAFERSQRIEPKVTTLVNLANCREKNQQLATAARLFAEAAEQLRAATDDGGVALRNLASERVAALQPRISRLTLHVTPVRPTGFEIFRGTVVLPAAQWSQPILLDGGTYPFSARAPGHITWTTTVTVRAEGDNLTIEIPALVPAPAGAPIHLVPPDAPDVGAPTTPGEGEDGRAPLYTHDELPVTPPPRRSLALPIGLGAGALALGGLAFGLDLHARSLQDDAIDLNYEENMTYDPIERELLGRESDNLHESAKRYRYVAQGVAVAAIGCAGAAVYLYVTGGRDSKSTTTASRSLSPVLSPGIAGMQLQGSW